MTILTVGNLGVPKTEIPKIPEIPKTSKDNCVCLLLPTNFLVYFVWSVLDTVIVLGPSLFKKERVEYNDSLLKIVCCGKKWQIGSNSVSAKK